MFRILLIYFLIIGEIKRRNVKFCAMHCLRNMLSAAMAADCDSLHENVILRWRHCKNKTKQTFEQVNSTDTSKNMKLNCISIAQVDFWIRVRPTFIFSLFFLFFFSLIEIQPFDCVFLVLVFVCLSHFVCCLTCQKQKQKTSNRFQSKCYSPCCCHGVKERGRKCIYTV